MLSVLTIHDATLVIDEKQLWKDLNLEVKPGEFIAIIGANGSGKTSLLKAILGQIKLTKGKIRFGLELVGKGNPHIGYIPQQRALDDAANILVKDLVRFGYSGHKLGVFSAFGKTNKKVRDALECADAVHLANKNFSELSGGEQQRVRVAQAIVSDPSMLLCDEPLSALDLQQQQIVSELIKREAKDHNTAVLFVTHDVNPVLDMVDRVLYLANGSFSIGTPDEVFRSDVLSNLYGTKVDVIRNNDRIVVVGAGTQDHHEGDHK